MLSMPVLLVCKCSCPQKSLATSNISNKLRASNLEASRQKGGRQTQLLDMPVQLQGGHNGECISTCQVLPPWCLSISTYMET